MAAEQEALRDLERLLIEDREVYRRFLAARQSRDVRLRYVAQRIREEAETFDREITALEERHVALRSAAATLWREHFDDRTRLDLAIGRATRVRRRHLVVHDKVALVEALDRVDRLDLVDYSFDSRAVLRLLGRGKLPLPDGAVEVTTLESFPVRAREA